MRGVAGQEAKTPEIQGLEVYVRSRRLKLV